MGKKTKTTSNQQYSNNYGYMNTPINAQMQAVIDASTKKDQVDPSIMHRYAEMGEDLKRSYMDPFGAATSPDVREKAQRSGLMKLGAQRDKAMREGYNEIQGLQFGRQMAAASLTAPQLVQTGGNASGTQTTKEPFNWGSLISGAATVGAAAL